GLHLPHASVREGGISNPKSRIFTDRRGHSRGDFLFPQVFFVAYPSAFTATRDGKISLVGIERVIDRYSADAKGTTDGTIGLPCVTHRLRGGYVYFSDGGAGHQLTPPPSGRLPQMLRGHGGLPLPQ